MDTPGITLRQLLPNQLDGVENRVKDKLHAEPPKPGASLIWNLAAEKALGEIDRALDVNVYSVLGDIWCKAIELRKYKDPKQYPATKTTFVHLGDHELPPVLIRMKLEIKLGLVPILTLEFVLELTVHFRSVEIAIRNGHIISIGAGDGSIIAQLKCEGGRLHPPFESPPVTPNLKHKFPKPGLAIA